MAKRCGSRNKPCNRPRADWWKQSIGVDWFNQSSGGEVEPVDFTADIQPGIAAVFPGIEIWREGAKLPINPARGNYKNNYNWDALKNSIPTTNTYYVDPVNGLNTNNGLQMAVGVAPAGPFKSIQQALNTTGRDRIIIKPGFYYYTEGWRNVNSSTQARPLRVHVEGDGASGRAIISTARVHSFVVNGTFPDVYEYDLATPVINVVVDRSNIDPISGRPVRLTTQTSLANVNANPGSMWYDFANTILYVRTFDSRVPDSNIIVLERNGNAQNNGIQNLFIENCDFWGGGNNNGVFPITNSLATPSTCVLINCDFDYHPVEDGLYCSGRVTTYRKNCGCYYNTQDGFNDVVNATNSISSNFFNDHCHAMRNGVGTDDNNMTSHSDCRGIDIGGNYQYSVGRSVHHVNTAQVFHLGLTSGNSTSGTASVRTAFASGTPGAGGGFATNCKFLECEAVGANAQAVSVADDAIVECDNPLFSQTQLIEAGGTLTQIADKP